MSCIPEEQYGVVVTGDEHRTGADKSAGSISGTGAAGGTGATAGAGAREVTGLLFTISWTPIIMSI
jgi:hypothetical protein